MGNNALKGHNAVRSITPEQKVFKSDATPDAAALMLAKAMQEIEDLKAKLAKKGSSPIGLKVSEKGAVSFYGVGRWPVTLYGSQWETLIANIDKVKAFIAENKGKLSVKPE